MKSAGTESAGKGGLLSKVKTFETLRQYRNFRFLWMSTMSYQIGWWMLQLVMSWLAYDLTKSAFLTAVFTAARLAPSLLGPFVGTFADRVNRRRLLITAQLAQVASAAVMAILVMTGLIQFWHLALVGFIDGLVWSMTYSTSYAMAMDIVGKENTSNAVALNVVAMDITRIIGPAAGGFLIGGVGPANCFWTGGVFCALATVAILPMQNPARRTEAKQGSVMRNLAEGFNFVIHNRNLLSVLLVSFTANIFIWPAYQSFMPVYARENLNLGPEGLGILQTAMGVGSLISALIIASMGNFTWKGKMFLGGTALLALFFGAFAVSRSYPLALLLIAFAGLTSTCFNTMQSTLTLRLAPEDMRARCMGFLQMAIGIYSVGSLVIGAVAGIIGAGLATAISCGILFVLMIVISIAFPSLRRMD